MAIKKPFVVKESQPVKPVHDFTQNREEWELSVFQNADYFTVIVFTGNGGRFRKEFQSLKEAIWAARKFERKVVYAVTAVGRSVLLPPERWDEYLKDWERRVSNIKMRKRL